MPRSYEIDFMFAMADFSVSDDADEPERDMVKMAFSVNPDDTWSFSIGRHVSLGPHIDASLHNLEGDATTSAPDLLRALTQRIVAPHEVE